MCVCVWLGHCKSFMAAAPWPTTAPSPRAQFAVRLACRLFTPTRDHMVVNTSPPSKFKSRQHEPRDLRLQQAFLSIGPWCPAASSGLLIRRRARQDSGVTNTTKSPSSGPMPSCQEQLPQPSPLLVRVRRSIDFFFLQQQILAARVFPRKPNDRADTDRAYLQKARRVRFPVGEQHGVWRRASRVGSCPPAARAHPKFSCGRKEGGTRPAGAQRQLGHPHSGTSQLGTQERRHPLALRLRWFQYLSVRGDGEREANRRGAGDRPGQSSGCLLTFAV